MTTPTYRPRRVEKAPPCQGACLAEGDVRGWIGTIAQRRKLGIDNETAYGRAWQIITEVNPFPAVLGRICPHPCQTGCNRSGKDGEVEINALERFLGDWAIERGIPLRVLERDARAESVGVIGAGPSGLSFAYQMARRGYPVTVYERQSQPGGMLRHGVPDFRLPPRVLEAEIQRIVDLGVEIRLEVPVGTEVTLDELRARHDLLYLGVGAQQGRSLGIPGENGDGVLVGIDYLRRVNGGEQIDLGERVAVVGGGNTALDAARTARRTGAQVTVLYRRSSAEMPATLHEVEEARQEGIRFDFLVMPVAVEREDGRPRSLVLRCVELGKPDESGRRRPVPVPGSDFEMPVDAVIAAIAQEPDWTQDTDDWRLWAGGDMIGAGLAGVAIAQGRRAAETAHAHLTGLDPPPAQPRQQIGSEALRLDRYESRPAVTPDRLPVALALTDQEAEVNYGITEAQFLAEVERCLSCGSCFGCQQCWMYCTASCFTSVAEAAPGTYFTLSLDECRECGKCIEVCPCGYLEVSPPAPL